MLWTLKFGSEEDSCLTVMHGRVTRFHEIPTAKNEGKLGDCPPLLTPHLPPEDRNATLSRVCPKHCRPVFWGIIIERSYFLWEELPSCIGTLNTGGR